APDDGVWRGCSRGVVVAADLRQRGPAPERGRETAAVVRRLAGAAWRGSVDDPLRRRGADPARRHPLAARPGAEPARADGAADSRHFRCCPPGSVPPRGAGYQHRPRIRRPAGGSCMKAAATVCPEAPPLAGTRLSDYVELTKPRIAVLV